MRVYLSKRRRMAWTHWRARVSGGVGFGLAGGVVVSWRAGSTSAVPALTALPLTSISTATAFFNAPTPSSAGTLPKRAYNRFKSPYLSLSTICTRPEPGMLRMVERWGVRRELMRRDWRWGRVDGER